MSRRIAVATGLVAGLAGVLSPFLMLPRPTFRDAGLFEAGWVMGPYAGYLLLAFITRRSPAGASTVLAGLIAVLAMAVAASAPASSRETATPPGESSSWLSCSRS